MIYKTFVFGEFEEALAKEAEHLLSRRGHPGKVGVHFFQKLANSIPVTRQKIISIQFAVIFQ